MAKAISAREQVRTGPGDDRFGPTSPVILVVLVDTQGGRLLEGASGSLTEVAEIIDPVERHVDHDTEIGGWDHRHEEATRRHLRRVAAAVTRYVDGHPATRLVLGGPDPAARRLMHVLPRRVLDRLVGRIPGGLRTSDRGLRDAVLDTARRLTEMAEADMVDDLRSRIRAGHATGGLEETLQALNRGQVGALVAARGLAASGRRCPACGYLTTSAPDCPWCATPTERTPDLVAEALQRAVDQGADVVFVAPRDLEEIGGIAATERSRRLHPPGPDAPPAPGAAQPR